MSSHEMKSTRLEAFSDGVIAVIITIMVLELHVPEANGLAGLAHLAPRIGLYALSFLLTAIYWINHHELLRRIETANYRILWSNLIFLFTLSLVPFFTDYVAEKHFDSFSTALYCSIMLIAALGYLLLRFAVDKHRIELGETLEHASRMEAIKHLACLLLDAAAVPLAYKSPIASLVTVLFVSLIWTVPEVGLKKPDNCTHPHATR